MKKASTLLVTALVPLFAATMMQSCAGGENGQPMSGSGGDSGDGSGGSTGSGGGNGSGGSNNGSGGRVSGSGGSSSGGSSSGGKVGSGGTSSSGGTTGTASGGTTGTATGGTTGTATGGTTGGSCTPTDATMTVLNGLATSGTWTGYAYTYVGMAPATITPTCGTTGTCFMTSMKQLCVSGSVGPDPTYNASAGFGWNIGGATTTTTATPMAIVPGGTGLAYSVMGLAAPARFQLTDGAGKQYCADVPTPNTGTIPWATFAQMCYATPKGTAYSATTAISKIEIVVPSNAGTAVPFCFCVLSLGPA